MTPTDIRAEEREARVREIERALKFDPDHPYRRQLVREYLDLTDTKDHADERAA